MCVLCVSRSLCALGVMCDLRVVYVIYVGVCDMSVVCIAVVYICWCCV